MTQYYDIEFKDYDGNVIARMRYDWQFAPIFKEIFEMEPEGTVFHMDGLDNYLFDDVVNKYVDVRHCGWVYLIHQLEGLRRVYSDLLSDQQVSIHIEVLED